MTPGDPLAPFGVDGSLRDIYVLDTTVADWQRLLDVLNAGPRRLEYGNGDGPAPPPTDAAAVFGEAGRNTMHLLSVDLGGVRANCHFFWTGEIEFDLDPREVRTPDDAAAVFAFMRALGRGLRKPVRLTPENAEELVLAEYLPDRDRREAAGGAGVPPVRE